MIFRYISQCSSVQFSRSVVSDSLWPHEPQHARPLCPSPSPGVHPNPRPTQGIFYYQCTSIITWTIISTYVGCALLTKIFIFNIVKSTNFFYQVHVNFWVCFWGVNPSPMPIFSYTNVYQRVLLILSLQCVLICEGVLSVFNLFFSPKPYIFISYVIFYIYSNQCTNLPPDSYHNFYQKCIW